MDNKLEIFFHPGFGKTGTTYLQYKFFPKLRGIEYIPRTRMHKAIKKLHNKQYGRFLVSREHDRDFYKVTSDFAKKFPQTKTILVLRRHDKWIASQYRRLTKNGRGLFFNEFIDVENNKGRWDIDILNYYDRVLFLEKIYGSKPLVLFHEELKEDPFGFFDKIAKFTGAEYTKETISLSAKHTAYSDNQLKAVRRFARKTFLKKYGQSIVKENGFERRFRKVICHIIMYMYWLIPIRVEKNEPLIPKEELEKIRHSFAEDWEKCRRYSDQNPVETLI